MIRSLAALSAALLATVANAASFEARVLPPPAAPDKDVAPFVAVPAGVIALTHVRVIDGTGAAPQEHETLVIEHGRIAAVQPPSAPLPHGARVIDLKGSSVLPGLVGMHDHLFYIARPNLTAQGSFDAPLVCRRWRTRRLGCISPAGSPRCAQPAASSPTPT